MSLGARHQAGYPIRTGQEVRWADSAAKRGVEADFHKSSTKPVLAKKEAAQEKV